MLDLECWSRWGWVKKKLSDQRCCATLVAKFFLVSAAKRRPTRMLRLCAGCNKTYFCNRQCQLDGWTKHMKECKRACKRKKLDYSKDKILVGEQLSVAMRGGGHKGVLGTILNYV